MPGQLLPLWLLRRSELQTAEAALAAPKPLDRLLIVVSADSEPPICQCRIYNNRAVPSAAVASKVHLQQPCAKLWCTLTPRPARQQPLSCAGVRAVAAGHLGAARGGVPGGGAAAAAGRLGRDAGRLPRRAARVHHLGRGCGLVLVS